MFCNQCEQTYEGTGCVDSPGVCGKSEDVQSLQEILLYGLKGMAAYAHHARRLGKTDEQVSAFIEEALFATMTNVNFDVPTLIDLCMEVASTISASWRCWTTPMWRHSANRLRPW
jgi:hydroxylamine reductase